MDVNGLHTRREHPLETIEIPTNKPQFKVFIVSVENGSLVCYPPLTRGRAYGALWMRMPGEPWPEFCQPPNACKPGITLERSIRGAELFQKQKQLEAAYAELEITYDRTFDIADVSPGHTATGIRKDIVSG